MVLRPLDVQTPNRQPGPAWEAVERTQKCSSRDWWLISQPDHASLAGDLAARISWENIPSLDPEILEAIRLHDEGWAEFDRMPLSRAGRPLSFLDFQPADFLKAWRISINRAEESSAIGSLLVSSHFRRLGEFRLRLSADAASDIALVDDFLRAEKQRESRLTAAQGRSGQEIQILVDVLQFCDLLSLYLCSGSREEVEFPQIFQGQQVRAHYEDGLYRTHPGIFGGGASLGVTARKYSSCDRSSTISILLG
ncbi:MAG TPA: DUF3891 family protein [Terriglobales bacterium]|nr:DUF3891 family protein [Terriglobales bacterium]